jgi:hypothetical protein
MGDAMAIMPKPPRHLYVPPTEPVFDPDAVVAEIEFRRGNPGTREGYSYVIADRYCMVWEPRECPGSVAVQLFDTNAKALLAQVRDRYVAVGFEPGPNGVHLSDNQLLIAPQ